MAIRAALIKERRTPEDFYPFAKRARRQSAEEITATLNSFATLHNGRRK
jgi:hypothetical protein